MARRIALARAIALDPELIMYDEPFAGLDLISMGVAAKLIRTLNDVTGATSLVVSHDVPECMAISDYVVLLATQGRIVAQGTPAELMASHRPRDAPVRARRTRRAGEVPLPGARDRRRLRRCEPGMNFVARARRHRAGASCAAGATPPSSSWSCCVPCRRRCAASAWWWRRSTPSATARWSSSWPRAWRWASCWRCRCTTRW